MPVTRCGNGKYRVSGSKCMYRTKAKAEAAYKGYIAKKRAGTTYKAMESRGK